MSSLFASVEQSMSDDNVSDSSIEIIEPNISTITVNSSPLSLSSNDESNVICYSASTNSQSTIWKNVQKQQTNIIDLHTDEYDSDYCEVTSTNTSNFFVNLSSPPPPPTSSFDGSINIFHCGSRIRRTTNWRNAHKQQTRDIELPNAGGNYSDDFECCDITTADLSIFSENSSSTSTSSYDDDSIVICRCNCRKKSKK